MESGRRVRLYVSHVCFRNMGRQDLLFNFMGGRRKENYGAYVLCCAFADTSATYRSLVENLADTLQTGIVEMSDLAEGDPAMLQSMKHVNGVYTDGNVFAFSDAPAEEKPYRKPGKEPSWRIAYVKFQDGTARHYYAQVGSADLFRTLLQLFAARYGKPIEDIVSIREVYKPDLFHRLLMRLYGAKPGHMLTLRMMHELKHAYQDMGLYRF